MDQFAHYHELTRCLFEKIEARLRLFNSASQEICRFIDEEQGHYALMFTGWREGRRILDLYLNGALARWENLDRGRLERRGDRNGFPGKWRPGRRHRSRLSAP